MADYRHYVSHLHYVIDCFPPDHVLQTSPVMTKKILAGWGLATCEGGQLCPTFTWTFKNTDLTTAMQKYLDDPVDYTSVLETIKTCASANPLLKNFSCAGKNYVEDNESTFGTGPTSTFLNMAAHYTVLSDVIVTATRTNRFLYKQIVDYMRMTHLDTIRDNIANWDGIQGETYLKDEEATREEKQRQDPLTLEQQRQFVEDEIGVAFAGANSIAEQRFGYQGDNAEAGNTFYGFRFPPKKDIGNLQLGTLAAARSDLDVRNYDNVNVGIALAYAIGGVTSKVIPEDAVMGTYSILNVKHSKRCDNIRIINEVGKYSKII
jgi:hypothetical protein